MAKRYITLFKDLARTSATSAEIVMDYYIKEKGGEGVETATIMRNNFQTLYNKIDTAKDDYNMTKSDAAQLAIGAIIMIGQLQGQIEQLKKALAGYQTDVMPKLQAIVDEALDDEAASKLAEEKFIIQNNE